MKKLYTLFLEMEKNPDLFCFVYDGVYIWERIRYCVFCLIVQERIGKSYIVENKDSLQRKIVKILQQTKLFAIALYFFVIDSIFYNPLFLTKADLLFIGTPRKKKLPCSSYWSLFVDPLVEESGSYKTAILRLENRYRTRFRFKTKEIYYFGIFRFHLVLYYMISMSFRCFHLYHSSEVDMWSIQLQRRIFQEFGVHINIKQIAWKCLQVSHFDFFLWSMLFKKIKPEILFVPGSQGVESIISAAKKENVIVVELQHGLISRYNLAYSFEGNCTKRDFPDYLFTFGEFFGTIQMDYPIPGERILPIGFPYFNKCLENNHRLKRTRKFKKNQIVFLSQGPIGDELYEFACRTKSHFLGKIPILYRLHPDERKEMYELKIHSQSNVIRLIDNEIDLYELLDESKWVVGVFSTAVYEAIELGCIPFLVDLPGVEHLEPLWEKGYAKRVQCPEDIDLAFSPARPPQGYLFAENWEENFVNALHTILEKQKSTTQQLSR